MNGRDDTAAFLPLDSRIGGQSRNGHPTVGQYLTRDQARHIYNKKAIGLMAQLKEEPSNVETKSSKTIHGH